MQIRVANLTDCSGIARVQVDSYRKAYGGILPVAYLDHFTYQEQEQDWADLLSSDHNDVFHVAATDSQEIVGYALARQNCGDFPEHDSELVALHVKTEYMQRGLGRQLINSAIGELHNRGGRSLFVWVLADNPARHFYEKLGGVLVGQQPWQNNEHFGTDIYEVAYGWSDILEVLGREKHV